MPKKGRTPKRPTRAKSASPAPSKSSPKPAKRQRKTKGDEKPLIDGSPPQSAEAQREAKNASDQSRLTDQGPGEEAGFTPRTLDRSVIAMPLLMALVEESKTNAHKRHEVVIDLHLEFAGGRPKAGARLRELIGQLLPRPDGTKPTIRETSQYMFATLYGDEIRELVRLDKKSRAIYRIWPDFPIRALLVRSVSTVKADAAHSSFAAFGMGIVWAVVDSGVDGNHPHFKTYGNVGLDDKLEHYDFTLDDPKTQPASGKSALVDEAGHGTHVAGIIAGALQGKPNTGAVRAVSRRWTEDGNTESQLETYDSISGMAPRCKIVSMKVLDATGNGRTSSVIQALERIQEINGYGRRVLIHGVNLSVGYDFEPEWFACGQSPLCVEVDRLVRSGVVVVVAAGNTGYGVQSTQARGNVSSGIPLSINDPGNAALAITVGSTHRDMPHTYGVSYFSSKGPTGDGRLKPDVLAPGEKILSCAAGATKKEASADLAKAKFDYVEQSGTSMAAPHVSGVVAAFLSVRREFIGQPEKVKELFMTSATDLQRDRYFQGSGLVDLMRAIQSV
jgi:serine protease AprX